MAQDWSCANLRKDSPQGQITYIRPEWKIWHCFYILLLVVLCGAVLGFFQSSVQRPIGFFLLLNVVQFACFLLIPLYIAGVLHKQPSAALGIQERPLTYGLGRAIAWGVGLYAANVLCSALVLQIFPQQPEEVQPIVQMMLEAPNTFEIAGLIFCVTVLAPVGEELFFRAFLFGAVEARFGRWAGIIVSAILFGAVHGSIWVFPPMFVGGIGFALLYAKYRDISMNIVAHSVWNSIVVVLVYGLLYGNYTV